MSSKKVTEKEQKRLLLSNARHRIVLTNNESTINVASYHGHINFGPVEPSSVEADSHIFIQNRTVVIYHDAIAPMIRDCLEAYKMYKSRDFKPFEHVLSTTTYQRIISSFAYYQNAYFYQLRIQFRPKRKLDENGSPESLYETIDDISEADWKYTRKGIVLNSKTLYDLLRQMDYLVLWSLPPNDPGQTLLSDIYEKAHTLPLSRLADEFLKNVNVENVNNFPFLARKKKIRELLSIYSRFRTEEGKKKPFSETQIQRNVALLIERFIHIFLLFYILKNFSYIYMGKVEYNEENNSTITENSAPTQ